LEKRRLQVIADRAIRICPECGKPVDPKAKRYKYCSEVCRNVANTRRNREEYERNKQYYIDRHKNNYVSRKRVSRQVRFEHTWTVTYDPLGVDGGGFRAGISVFQAGEVKKMKADGCLAIGTMFESKGKQYRYNGTDMEVVK